MEDNPASPGTGLVLERAIGLNLERGPFLRLG